MSRKKRGKRGGSRPVWYDQNGVPLPLAKVIVQLPKGTLRKWEGAADMLGTHLGVVIAIWLEGFLTPELSAPSPQEMLMPDEPYNMPLTMWLPSSIWYKLAMASRRTRLSPTQIIVRQLQQLPDNLFATLDEKWAGQMVWPKEFRPGDWPTAYARPDPRPMPRKPGRPKKARPLPPESSAEGSCP